MNTRLLHPLHNLNQTACDIILFLKQVKQADFIHILTTVRSTYAAPAESWLKFIFVNRKRIGELDAAIKNPDGFSALDITVKILETGGWQETSANTALLRAFLNQLPAYDQTMHLTLSELTTLKDLLILWAKKSLDTENFLPQLNESESVIKEAKIIGEAAIKTFLQERHKKQQKNNELRQDNQKQDVKKRLNFIEIKNEIRWLFQPASNNEMKKQEINKVCSQRDKTQNQAIKNKLASIFAAKPIFPEKKITKTLSVDLPIPHKTSQSFFLSTPGKISEERRKWLETTLFPCKITGLHAEENQDKTYKNHNIRLY